MGKVKLKMNRSFFQLIFVIFQFQCFVSKRTYRGIKPLVFCSKRTNVDVLIGRDSAATLISDVDTIRRCSVTFKLEPSCDEMKLSCQELKLKNRNMLFIRSSSVDKTVKFYTGQLPKEGVISNRVMKVLYKGKRLRDLECQVVCTSGH